jgi:SAM-dependent methyltransferase
MATTDQQSAPQFTGSRAQAFGCLRFELSWHDDDVHYWDHFVVPHWDFWRDLIPPELTTSVQQCAVNETIRHVFAPNMLIADEPQPLLTLKAHQFNRQAVQCLDVMPQHGRFYPRRFLRDVPGVFHVDGRPFRLLSPDASSFQADLNHPLANRSLTFGVTIEEIWPATGEQRGGRCKDSAQLVTENGPGMQARWHQEATDFWSYDPFSRLLEESDTLFYAQPRLLSHLDTVAIAELTALYQQIIPDGGQVLDLMASWQSHLPPTAVYDAVVGLGLNAVELEANPRLTERIVQDLNQSPSLPFASAQFDTIVCSLSIEYVTQPQALFTELVRILKPGGRLVISFSNRWFPPKCIRIWRDLHEFERLGLVLDYFLQTGQLTNLTAWSLRGRKRPDDDKYSDQSATSDPIYAVWGTRSAVS